MRDARKLILALSFAALAACKPANDNNNVAIDINTVSPNDIETLPPDESSDTPSDQLANGADNADVNDVDENAAANND